MEAARFTMDPSGKLNSISPSKGGMGYIIATENQQKDACNPKTQKMEKARMHIIFILKLIKIFLCTVALALVLKFSDDYKIKIKCPDEEDVEVHTQVEFPFRLHELSHETTACNSTVEQIYFENNFSVESGVFVAMAVVTIVYVSFTLLVHWKKHGKPVYLILDALYHGVLTALWLNSSFVWAVGLEHFMGELEFDNIKHINRHICQGDGELCTLHKNVDFLLLDISVLLGFIIALVGVVIVVIICTQVCSPSEVDNSKWTHDQQDLYKNKNILGDVKLIVESDASSTSSAKQSIEGSDNTSTSSVQESC
ncbi:unnamed protein product [Meganyctiphanes norvegica]|uniref:MARVEL domain-containing protein n=1 Tax=Meganyctiphanes norvegica TaxID=48144 RepID=A0AAV2PV62_MEGNR